ncbi:transmembrane protein, putative (macronuclear) [Tetrahymena thermophila SB210]|uniref:Transmembrane protein, putative n=1 Tax=Tetrahymena thermophila (strain SB210) TaxID=312017 RepID=W7XIT7_TETTS|nr:transmembrane protein, putative [Tetrahymena thermophila SB210]EWS73599.1 transmembrane protein, putative [Tetrahymena thermophila SB210]|eukprot:XP_012653829.1 transmembrane protein, putative [Tetrahymena thermophila SB210]
MFTPFSKLQAIIIQIKFIVETYNSCQRENLQQIKLLIQSHHLLTHSITHFFTKLTQNKIQYCFFKYKQNQFQFINKQTQPTLITQINKLKTINQDLITHQFILHFTIDHQITYISQIIIQLDMLKKLIKIIIKILLQKANKFNRQIAFLLKILFQNLVCFKQQNKLKDIINCKNIKPKKLFAEQYKIRHYFSVAIQLYINQSIKKATRRIRSIRLQQFNVSFKYLQIYFQQINKHITDQLKINKIITNKQTNQKLASRYEKIVVIIYPQFLLCIYSIQLLILYVINHINKVLNYQSKPNYLPKMLVCILLTNRITKQINNQLTNQIKLINTSLFTN